MILKFSTGLIEKNIAPGPPRYATGVKKSTFFVYRCTWPRGLKKRKKLLLGSRSKTRLYCRFFFTIFCSKYTNKEM